MDWGLKDTVLQNSFIVIYAITLVVAMVRYPKYFDTPLKYLPILFAYTFLNELLGGLLRYHEEFSLFVADLYAHSNQVIYNIYTLVFYLYFYYIFWSYVDDGKYRGFIVYGGLFFLAVGFINPFFQDFMLEPQLYAYIVGALVLMGCIVCYFLQLRSQRNPRLKNNILFWLGLGLLVFFLGYIPIKVMRYLYLENLVLRRIHLSLILIMYGCFTIGFIRMKGKLHNRSNDHLSKSIDTS